jgi:hypothetical protein
MSFWERMKQGLRNFMMGRNGPDRLGVALLWAGLALNLLSSLLSGAAAKSGSSILALLVLLMMAAGYGCYFFSIYRMFSRNLYKRQAEESRFVHFWENLKTKWRQALNRFKNRKQYKYFRCPCCKTRLRLPRGKGVVTVTCKCCHTSFTQKA